MTHFKDHEEVWRMDFWEVHSNPDIGPNLTPIEVCAHMPYHKVHRFTATLDISPQIAANRQWRYIGCGL